MVSPRATIAFVPREVYSTTRRSLETLYERTEGLFDLVCVDAGSPPELRNYLERQALEKQFVLIRADGVLTPNQSRNLAARCARTPYLAFVDNDVIVKRGWLDALVKCADETGAWVVGPLYWEHEPEGAKVHMFGGECRIDEDASGRRRYHERHAYAHVHRSELPADLARQETELIEFHTVLVSRDRLQQIGWLDEGLLSNGEHGDLCLQVRQAGGAVWLEPSAEITYVPPPWLEQTDKHFFQLRWSEAWANATHDHLERKYALSGNKGERRRALKWIGGHRRYGLPWLWKLKKALGHRRASSIEKRLIAPIERLINRRRYPAAEFGRLPSPTVRVIYDPRSREHVRRAAA